MFRVASLHRFVRAALSPREKTSKCSNGPVQDTQAAFMDEREAVTRQQRVDKMLQKSGWGPIVNYVRGAKCTSGAVREYETHEGPADYVLFRDGVPLAAVEAKRVGLGPQNVLVQAQRYARGFTDGPIKYE